MDLKFFVMIKGNPPSVTDYQTNALGGTSKMYSYCSNNPKHSEQRTVFCDWTKEAESSRIPKFEKCAKTYRSWSRYILNTYKYSHISNGSTEGFNNKIKVLKRTSYGIRNFENFGTRILMITN